jgi:uncharacterized protein (DUF433 family)
MRLTRITVDSGQMGGVPCLRGLRIPVATVVAMVADGMSEAEILAACPDPEREETALAREGPWRVKGLESSVRVAALARVRRGRLEGRETAGAATRHERPGEVVAVALQ